MTRLLYTDALVGVGIPNLGVALRAERASLAVHQPSHANVGGLPHEQWVWSREGLDKLPLGDLIDLYLGVRGMAFGLQLAPNEPTPEEDAA